MVGTVGGWVTVAIVLSHICHYNATAALGHPRKEGGCPLLWDSEKVRNTDSSTQGRKSFSDGVGRMTNTSSLSRRTWIAAPRSPRKKLLGGKGRRRSSAAAFLPLLSEGSSQSLLKELHHADWSKVEGGGR